MGTASFTGTASFLARIHRSEAARAKVMLAVYTVLILIAFARRVTGGAIMADNRIAVSSVTILALAAVYEFVASRQILHSLRKEQLISPWRLHAGALLELAVPSLLMLMMHQLSPHGQIAALSGPVLLLFPLTTLMTVLRLRPMATLWMGLGAHLFHLGLTLDTIRTEAPPPNQYPVLLSYTAVLALIGIAGMVVTHAARRYVAEAVEEAELRERAGLRLARVERDLEVARQIQTGLLPATSPRFDGYDLAGFNRPTEETGGDYYDWQELANGRLLVILADVTGHGIGPALVMAVCRAYARATAPLDSAPASIMARLNDLLHADIIGGRFITLAMTVLEPSGRAEIVSAGHGPTLFLHAKTREIEQFGGDGLPLAIQPQETYGPPRVITMHKDDILLILTDGVFEWQNSTGEQFGIERLSEALLAAADLDAAGIVKAIDHAVRTFAAGAPQTDDVTIVVVKRK